MNNILTIIFVIFLGVFAQAQNTANELNVETVTITIVEEAAETIETAKEDSIEVARLYRRANSVVKSALSFSTKRDRAKMA